MPKVCASYAKIARWHRYENIKRTTIHLSIQPIYEMAAVTATEESPFPPGPGLCCLCKMPCPDLRAHYLHANHNHGRSSSFGQGLCPRVECHRYSDNLAVHEILEHFIFIYSDQNDVDTQQQDSSASASRTCRKPHVELSTHPSHGPGDTIPDSLSEELPSPPAQAKTSCQSCNAKLSQGNEKRHWQHYCEFGPPIREPCPFCGSLLVPSYIPDHHRYHCQLGPRDKTAPEVKGPVTSRSRGRRAVRPHLCLRRRRAGWARRRHNGGGET